MLRAALTIALVLTGIAIGSGAPAAAAIGSARSASAQSDLLALINAYRATNGLPQVSPNGALTAAAAWMAGDMAARNYLGHVSSDGRSPTQRMSAFGYPATSTYTGEDLGAGYETAGAVLAGWQASPAHNAVLLNPNYDRVGIGLAYDPASTYKWYWAADFGGQGGNPKLVIPPPQPPEPPANGSTASRDQPVAKRAETAPRGSAQQATGAVEPEAPAQETRITFVDAKRIAHLLAVLQRMGEI